MLSARTNSETKASLLLDAEKYLNEVGFYNPSIPLSGDETLILNAIDCLLKSLTLNPPSKKEADSFDPIHDQKVFNKLMQILERNLPRLVVLPKIELILEALEIYPTPQRRHLFFSSHLIQINRIKYAQETVKLFPKSPFGYMQTACILQSYSISPSVSDSDSEKYLRHAIDCSKYALNNSKPNDIKYIYPHLKFYNEHARNHYPNLGITETFKLQNAEMLILSAKYQFWLINRKFKRKELTLEKYFFELGQIQYSLDTSTFYYPFSHAHSLSLEIEKTKYSVQKSELLKLLTEISEKPSIEKELQEEKDKEEVCLEKITQLSLKWQGDPDETYTSTLMNCNLLQPSFITYALAAKYCWENHLIDHSEILLLIGNALHYYQKEERQNYRELLSKIIEIQLCLMEFNIAHYTEKEKVLRRRESTTPFSLKWFCEEAVIKNEKILLQNDIACANFAIASCNEGEFLIIKRKTNHLSENQGKGAYTNSFFENYLKRKKLEENQNNNNNNNNNDNNDSDNNNNEKRGTQFKRKTMG